MGYYQNAATCEQCGTGKTTESSGKTQSDDCGENISPVTFQLVFNIPEVFPIQLTYLIYQIVCTTHAWNLRVFMIIYLFYDSILMILNQLILYLPRRRIDQSAGRLTADQRVRSSTPLAVLVPEIQYRSISGSKLVVRWSQNK